MMNLLAYAVIGAVFLDVYIGRFRPIQFCTTEVLKKRYYIYVFLAYAFLLDMAFISAMPYFILVILDATEGLLIRNEIKQRE